MTSKIQEAAEVAMRKSNSGWSIDDAVSFGANFMLEELSKSVESVVCPKCKSDNLDYPDAQNCETQTRCCNCGNSFDYAEEKHNLLISANAKIAKLTEALEFYANEDNWSRCGFGMNERKLKIADSDEQNHHNKAWAESHGGKLARQALKSCVESKNHTWEDLTKAIKEVRLEAPLVFKKKED